MLLSINHKSFSSCGKTPPLQHDGGGCGEEYEWDLIVVLGNEVPPGNYALWASKGAVTVDTRYSREIEAKPLDIMVTPTNVYGFNAYKTTVTMPNSCSGLVLNPTAILFATGQHKPAQVGNRTVNFYANSENGITITLRNWYEENNARQVFALECLYGVALGNPKALYQMK